MALGMASRSMSMAPRTDCSTSTAWGGTRPACSCRATTLARLRLPRWLVNLLSGKLPPSSMRMGRCWGPSWSAIGGWGLGLDELVVASAQELHVLPRRALPLRVAQQRRRVVGHQEREAVEVVEGAAERAERGRPPEQPVPGALADGEEHLRADERDLLVEDREVRGDLLGLGVPVAGRAALEDVGDVDLLALEVDGLEDLVQ